VSGRRLRALACGAALLAGCSLSAFDDRRAQAWSDSNGAEGLSAADYGVAVAGVTTDLPGATIVGLGLEPGGLGVIRYDDTGALSLSGADVPELAAASLPAIPSLVGAPEPVPGAGALVAIGGLGDLDRILFYDVSGPAPVAVGAISGARCGDPGSNLGHAMAIGFTGAGVRNVLDLVALRGNEIFIFPDFDFSDATPDCVRCTLPSDPQDVGPAIALIDIGLGDGEEIMVSIGGGLTVFDAFQVEEADGAGAGCFEIRSPQISGLTSPGVEPDFGAQLAVGDADDDGEADVAATAPSAGRVYVVSNLTSSGPGGLLQSLAAPGGSGSFGLGPVAFLDLDGDDRDELVIGDPLASPAGVESAGQAYVFAASGDDGFELRGVLSDSEPEAGQELGRSLGVAEFVVDDDSDLLIAGAAGEIFTYFRALATASDPRR
jgi:hypothetical protein